MYHTRGPGGAGYRRCRRSVLLYLLHRGPGEVGLQAGEQLVHGVVLPLLLVDQAVHVGPQVLRRLRLGEVLGIRLKNLRRCRFALRAGHASTNARATAKKGIVHVYAGERHDQENDGHDDDADAAAADDDEEEDTCARLSDAAQTHHLASNLSLTLGCAGGSLNFSVERDLSVSVLSTLSEDSIP